MKKSYLAVLLLLLDIHVFLAALKSDKCPFYPVMERKRCKVKSDCGPGQSCCRYLLNKHLCTPTDPTGCYLEQGLRLAYGEFYVTDRCHRCYCYGYNAFQCRKIC